MNMFERPTKNLRKSETIESVPQHTIEELIFGHIHEVSKTGKNRVIDLQGRRARGKWLAGGIVGMTNLNTREAVIEIVMEAIKLANEYDSAILLQRYPESNAVRINLAHRA